MGKFNYRGIYFPIFLFLLEYISSNEQATQHPSRTVIVWHASTVQSFAAQKDFILRGISQLQTDYSEIIIIPVSATGNETLKITKTDKDWISDFVYLRFNQGNVIQNTLIKDALRKYLNHDTKTKIAEMLYFVVDDASEIDNVNEVVNELKRKKVFVICATHSGIPKMWQSLATDKNHILQLTGNKDDVVVENKLIGLSYNDSRLPCDTNLYWDDVRCTECINMCSMITKSVPPKCEKHCPYLDRTPTNLPTTIIQEDVETIISDHKGLIIGVIVITIIIVICLICLVVLRKRCCRRQRDVETALAGRDTTAVTETGHTEAGDNVPNNDDHSTEEQDEGHEETSFLDSQAVDDTASLATDDDSGRESAVSEPTGQSENHPEEPVETNEEKIPFSIDFRSGAELDANGHTFGGPVVKLHADTPADATYVKGQYPEDM
ncbi:uncharacterized protein LOC132742793 isoform X2 [Ruditapes philippinarum]|uniref:uncharacterized protein LOC132742793 isoform X2 n=1 Tax=Ruditapes philippinarum TaxID=129788 RepID=UPI00295BDE97|nr:uncharacterized protein LOC132742793 isoform X2 [Ruditapes philippinarum]